MPKIKIFQQTTMRQIFAQDGEKAIAMGDNGYTFLDWMPAANANKLFADLQSYAGVQADELTTVTTEWRNMQDGIRMYDNEDTAAALRRWIEKVTFEMENEDDI